MFGDGKGASLSEGGAASHKNDGVERGSVLSVAKPVKGGVGVLRSARIGWLIL